MRVLDLFCGAGGAGEGYARVGAYVLGIDNMRQAKNPHDTIIAEMDVPEDEAKLTYRNYRAMNHYKNELRFMRYATYGE